MRELVAGRTELASRLALGLAVYGFFAVSQPNFATTGNFVTILDGFAFAGLAALGLGLTIIAGEMDLSVGSVAAVAGVIAVQFSAQGFLIATLAAVLIATTFGVFQGLMIVYLKINSLVFTIGTLITMRGVAYLLSGGQTIIVADLAIAEVVRQSFWIFSTFSLVTIGFFLLVGSFIAYHRWGREIYAIGGGRAEAQAAGVTLYRPMAIAFGISAAGAGIAGALVSLKSGSAAPWGFENLLLPGATAALIGGVSLRGGKGSAVGIAIGALTIRFITSGLSLRGAPFFVENLALGVLLLFVIAFELFFETDAAKERWRRVGTRRSGTAWPGADGQR